MSSRKMVASAVAVLGASLALSFMPGCGTLVRKADGERRSSVEDVLAAQRPSASGPKASLAAQRQGPAGAALPGRSIYERRCGSCHRLHGSYEYSDAEWGRIVHVMARNAHLSGADEKLVLEYLRATN
jgi:mono/diheme cytochrome c family protein